MKIYKFIRRLLEVPFTNSSSVAVHHIDAFPLSPISIFDNNANKSSIRRGVQWFHVTCDDVQDQLPIQPGSSMLLPIIMKTEAKLDDSSQGKVDLKPVCKYFLSNLLNEYVKQKCL